MEHPLIHTAPPPTHAPLRACACCGGTERIDGAVLWTALVQEWRLSPEEVRYVDRQQGTRCTSCGANLRTMALASAILEATGSRGTFREFMAGPGSTLDVLEVNEAGQLTPFLRAARGHRLTRFPEVDIHALPFPDRSFDLVVHSDTLEHVERPIAALRECRRVLRDHGACAFTVPVIVDRLTLSRDGLPPSHHNRPEDRDPGQLVRTEYGADAWKHVIQAGFGECRLHAFEYPAALAFLATR